MNIFNLIDTDDNESLGTIVTNLNDVELQNRINEFKGVCYLSYRKKNKKDQFNYDVGSFCEWMYIKEYGMCAIFNLESVEF